MKIRVKVKPNAKKQSVERITQPSLGLSENESIMVDYKVSVKEAPIQGRANDAVLKALAGYFGVSLSLVRLVSGQTSKTKIFEIIM